MRPRVSDLPASKRGVVSVSQDATLSEAISKMALNDFSQLPVMSSDESLIGVISWKTIGNQTMIAPKEHVVRYHMDHAATLRITDGLLESVHIILEKEFAFVIDENERVSGIVTLFDIATQFKSLAEPFVEIRYIEHSVREIIATRLDLDVLQAIAGKNVKSEKDLGFRDYIRIFENKDLWPLLGINVDPVVFRDKFDSIRNVRNQVMHFKVGEVDPDDFKNLKALSKFFRRYNKLAKD